MSVWAVLAAAGRGERLGSDRPKAFARLGGRPLLAESLERLEASAWIDADRRSRRRPGGRSRAILVAEEIGAGKVGSVVDRRRGAGGVGAPRRSRRSPRRPLWSLVHDAARPLLPDAVIERVLAPLAEGWDGAVPALPVADTVKRVEQDQVVETLTRAELVAAQTPQAFVAPALRSALAGDLAAASDCSSLVEARGGRIKIVEGDRRLLKVTDAEDLALVESWLE